MTNQETNVANAAETTLNGALAAGATVIDVVDTADFPAVPFYITIDPGKDSVREIVLVDSAKSSTTFTLSDASMRGRDDTTDTNHDSGAVVAITPVAALWTDINDRVDAADAAIAAVETDLANHEGAADPHTQYLTTAEGDAAYADLVGAPITVLKTADESVTSSTTLQNDDHLTFTLGANKKYVAEWTLFVTGDITGDLRIGPVASGSVTASSWAGAGPAPALAGSDGEATFVGGTFSNVQHFGVRSTTTPVAVRITAYVDVGATSGLTLTVRWCQVTSSATPTTILAGSHLVYREVS